MSSVDQTGATKYYGSSHWFVIHTKPRDEHRVKSHFEGMKIEALLPLCEHFQSSRSRLCRMIQPLFPNYLLARLDLECHYYKVKWTRGVNRIIGAGSEPAPVSETVVQAL